MGCSPPQCKQFLFDKKPRPAPDMTMDEFDTRQHARLVGNALLGMAVFAFGLEVADLLPDEIWALPPHYFGRGGAALVGLLFLAAGLWLRGKKS